MFRKLVLAALVAALVFTGMLYGTVWFGFYEGNRPRPVGAPTPRPDGEGWIDLLSAENAPNWKNLKSDKELFTVEDGVLHIFGRSVASLGYATYTGQPFGDYDLHLEFRLSPPPRWSALAALIFNAQLRCNSGVFLRVPEGESPLRGFEVQVLGDHGWPPNKNGTGSIYDVVSPMLNMALPSGEWNSYDISLRGTKVTITVNGWKVIDTDFAQMTMPIGKFSTPYAELPLSGLIALQDHGGELWYRNILVRPAAGVEAAEIIPAAAL